MIIQDRIKFSQKGASGITVGTTPVTLGTDGRIFFQYGGVVQQDATLFWDNTNKRLGVGATPDASVRLDVRAQGALTSDIVLRLRNSANTTNIFDIRGDGTAGFRINGKSIYFGSGARIQTGSGFLTALAVGFGLVNCGLKNDFNGNGFSIWNLKQLAIGGSGDFNEASILLRGITTTPTVGYNQAKMWAAEVSPGNTAPHFMTENGAVIKLYQQSSAGISTVADLVLVLQNLGLLS